jgi:hypothetical protein
MISQYEIAEYQKAQRRYFELLDSLFAQLEESVDFEPGDLKLHHDIEEFPDARPAALKKALGKELAAVVLAKLPVRSRHTLRVTQKPPRKPKPVPAVFSRPAEPMPRLRPALSFEREDGTYD